jgi:hypothetical protein
MIKDDPSRKSGSVTFGSQLAVAYFYPFIALGLATPWLTDPRGAEPTLIKINLKMVWCVSSNRCSCCAPRSCRKGRASNMR